jgi:hypothetical protein
MVTRATRGVLLDVSFDNCGWATLTIVSPTVRKSYRERSNDLRAIRHGAFLQAQQDVEDLAADVSVKARRAILKGDDVRCRVSEDKACALFGVEL